MASCAPQLSLTGYREPEKERPNRLSLLSLGSCFPWEWAQRGPCRSLLTLCTQLTEGKSGAHGDFRVIPKVAKLRTGSKEET